MDGGHGTLVPVFMACSMSNASSPRTSPMMIRSGRMRRLLMRSCLWRTAPIPPRWRPGLEPHDILVLELQLGGVFDGDDPLGLGNKAGEDVHECSLARSVPPEIRMLIFAFTAAARFASSRGNALEFHQSLAATGPLPKRRMDMQGRPGPAADDGVHARASGSLHPHGEDSSTLRPTRRRCDRHLHQVPVVPEFRAGPLQDSTTFHIDDVSVVDQKSDTVDLSTRVPRVQPEDFVQKLALTGLFPSHSGYSLGADNLLNHQPTARRALASSTDESFSSRF